MKIVLSVFLLIVLLAPPAMAGSVSSDDFKVQTTQNLINLCTASKEDPLYNHALNFCHGYLVGAFHYYMVSNSGPKADKLVCFPEKGVTRNQAIKMFVDWAEAHPQFMQEKPVETEFRFLMATWPCP